MDEGRTDCQAPLSLDMAKQLRGDGPNCPRLSLSWGFIAGMLAAKFGANAQSKPTLLDLGKSYPRGAIFTAVIYGNDRSRLGTPQTLAPGASASCVTGRSAIPTGKPEIVLIDPSQLTR